MRDRSELRGYQDRVAGYLYEHDSAFAILKMGSGKTISALTAAEEMIRDGVIRHGLILAPKRVAELVWPDEIRLWSHTAGLKFAVLKGHPMQRLKTLMQAVDRQITICGIDNAQWLAGVLATLPPAHPLFDLLVIDETSRFKSPKSKRAKALSKLMPLFGNRWGLTGTPRPNSALDLFTPVGLITAGKLWGRSFYAWRQTRFYAADFQGYDWRPLPGTEERIREDLRSIAVTLADDDMPDLPDLNILLDRVVLPPDPWEQYRRMKRELFTTLDDGRNVVAVNAAVSSGKLAQIAQGFLYPETGDSTYAVVHDEKIDWIADLVSSLDGEPVIVVYEFLADLDRLRALWPDAPVIGHGGGKTEPIVRDWNAGHTPVLLLHAASGGHGLNLQHGGSRMAWLAPCWSPELWEQTIARIYRPGQASAKVSIHVCIAEGTVDEAKRMRVIDKLSRQEALERWLKQNVAA